jgi:hypothetical protein
MRDRRNTTIDTTNSVFKPSYDLFDNAVVRNATMRGGNESDCSTFRKIVGNNAPQRFKKPFLFEELIAETAKHKRSGQNQYQTNTERNSPPHHATKQISIEKSK